MTGAPSRAVTAAAFGLRTYFAVGNYCGCAACVAVSASVGASSAGTRGSRPAPAAGARADPTAGAAPYSHS